LILFPLLWGLGFVFSRWQGCDTDLALSKATAYAISGFAGYLTFLLTSRLRRLTFFPFWASPSMLGPTITPWPFWKMLGFGLASSLSVGLVIGVLFRFAFHDRFLTLDKTGKALARSSVHPLSDDQIG
jgi:hypothetical protein